jgi:DNA polymerase-3 subunit delta
LKLTGAALRRFLDSPDPAIGAILLYGPNRTLAAEATDRLLAHALKGNEDPFALTKIAEDDLKRDKARLDEALRAQSLLGGARVVRVRVDGDSCADVLLAATAALDRGENLAHLLVDGGDLGGSSKLVKGFEAARRAAVPG